MIVAALKPARDVDLESVLSVWRSDKGDNRCDDEGRVLSWSPSAFDGLHTNLAGVLLHVGVVDFRFEVDLWRLKRVALEIKPNFELAAVERSAIRSLNHNVPFVEVVVDHANSDAWQRGGLSEPLEFLHVYLEKRVLTFRILAGGGGIFFYRILLK